MRKRLRGILIPLGILLLILFGLLVLVWLLLQRPAIQQRLQRELTEQLSRRLDTRLSIGRLRLHFFDHLLLEDVYLEDLAADTLLYAGRLEARLQGLFPFRQKANIEIVALQDIRLQLQRPAENESFNFQFLLDAFSSEEPAPESGEPWTFSLGDLRIENLDFSLTDDLARQYSRIKWRELQIRPQKLDLANQRIDLHALAINGLEMAFANATTPPSTDTTSTPPVFPDIGWAIRLDQLTIGAPYLQYDRIDQPAMTTAGRLDPDHLQINDLQLQMEKIEWDSTTLAAAIRDLSFSEKSGLRLMQTQSELALTPQSAAIRSFRLTTPDSRLAYELDLAYGSFADWSDITQLSVDFQLRESKLNLADLAYFFGDTLGALQLDRESFVAGSGQVKGPVSNLSIEDLNLTLADAADITVSGNVRQFSEPEKFKSEGLRLAVSLDNKKLRRRLPNLSLPGGLDRLGRIAVEADLKGTSRRLQLGRLDITTEAHTSLQLTGLLQDWTKPAQLQLRTDTFRLRTRPEDWRGFLSDTLPGPVERLGAIAFDGTFAGTLRDFVHFGQWETAVGPFSHDLQISFTPDYQDARYQVNLAADRVALDRLLADTLFGQLGLRAQLKGRGLRPDSMRTDLRATVGRFDMNRYTYRNLNLNATLDGPRLDSRLRYEDDHLALHFAALAGWRDSLLRLRIDTGAVRADLAALGWSADSLTIRTELEMDFPSLSAADPQGELFLRNTEIKDETGLFQSEKLHLAARRLASGRREITLASEVIGLELFGNYDPNQLAPALLQYFDRKISLAPLLDLPDSTGAGDIDLTGRVWVYPDKKLTTIFLPALSVSDTVRLDARFAPQSDGLSFRFRAPRIAFGDQRIDSLRWSAAEREGRFFTQLSTHRIALGEEATTLRPKLELEAGNDRLGLRFMLDAETLGQLYDVQAEFVPRDSQAYRLRFQSPFVFSDARWQVAPDHYVDLAPGYLRLAGIRFEKGEEVFYLTAESPPDTVGIPPLAAGFANYQLSNISRLVSLDSSFLTGALDGTISAALPAQIEADLQLRALRLDGQPVGELSVAAASIQNGKAARLSTVLDGPSGQLDVQGDYVFQEQAFDLEIDLQQLALPLLETFAGDYIRNAAGAIDGRFTLRGTTSRPDLAGELTLAEAGAFIEFLQLRYRTQGRHTITIDNKLVDIGTLALYDNENRRAELSGRIEHDHFSDIGLDLQLSTPEFPFLRTQPTDTSRFYGTVLLAVDARIRGTPTLPRVDVQATTLDSTRLFVQPLTESQAIADQDFIAYGPPPDETDPEGRPSPPPLIEPRTGLDLSLQMEVTPSAELQVIIDPATQEKLSARGRAAISVEMDPQGNLRTTGAYTLEEGSYLLNYQGLVKKNFQIQPGSRIILPGDPLQSEFDITALYATRTAPYNLLRQRTTLSETETAAARRRMDFQIEMQMSGTLEDLDIQFNIRVPETEDGQLAEQVRSQLNALQNDPNELNTQVFGLLLFDSFITQGGGQASIAGVGESLALSSISNLISNRLNRLSERYVKGVELDVGVESYKAGPAESQSTVTEVQLGLTKRLFDDRLSVRVGGNVDLETQEQASSATYFTSDFVLEYKLTPSGAYRVRVFNRYDYDLLNGENVNESGVGLRFQRSFGRSGKKENE